MTSPANKHPHSLNDLPSLAIRRPLLVLVLNLLIIIAGIAAVMGVEIRELPDVDRPIVSVRGNYPGASPETMDAEVTSIVEGAVARVSGIRSINSASEEGNFRIRVEFSPDSDLDAAASDIREAVSQIERDLPDDVEQLTVVKADADSDPIMRLVAYSDTLSEEALTDVVETDIVPELISVDGVADVTLFGNRQRQMRVVVDPLRLTALGLSVIDLAEVLEEAPFDVPSGSFNSSNQELIVRADASVITPDGIENLIIRDNIRLRDVAQVFFGPEEAESFVRLDGRIGVGLGVIRQARSNTINISDGIRTSVEELNQRFGNVHLEVTADDAIFIKGSVREVLFTLLISVLIVVATIWLFMGSLRSTLIPAVSIPVALVGTVSAIWLLGFSINLLTLLALVLATGMIVDDSIVVLENIQRRKGQGLASRAAAVLGTRQVFFAVIATTATLISVFVPISFLPSTAGRLFREFGFVLAISVAISSFVALSMVPSLAARLPAKDAIVPDYLSRPGRWLARLYDRSLEWVLNVPLVVAAGALAFAGFCYLLFINLDQELLPSEDRGILYISANAPDGVGLAYSETQANRIEDLLAPYVAQGEISRILTIIGWRDPNRVFVIAPLAPWEQRSKSQQEIMAELRLPLLGIPGVRASIYSPNSLNLRDSGNGVQVALLGNEYPVIYEAAKSFAAIVEQQSAGLEEPDISYQPTQPQLSLRIDRQRAADLGLPLNELSATLRAMIDGDDIVDLSIEDDSVPILLEATTGAINDPTDLVNLYARGESGKLVPLSSVVELVEEGVASELDRLRQRRSIRVNFNLKPGYPLSRAVDDLRQVADENLPPGIEMVLQGDAEALTETSHEVALTYVIALLVVFLVLAAQFESITSAAVVISTVPFGIAAAVLALWLTGTSINIYSQIGLVMLIGLMAKNGILVVEFADQLRDQGLEVREAIATSASVRLRPIAMTMISTILGGLPLILSGGAGAEARAAIGWVVFGGLGIAAIFTLYLTPLAYLGLARLTRPRASEAGRLERELKEAASIHDVGGGAPAQ
jgi:hydrophobe/amphiphile efflux-1 (HAE1) family protein